MILQAYDFLELSRRYDCCLQMGGSDQWGNIVNGVELARRIDQRALYGLTTPLITPASGAQMGKTAAVPVRLGAHSLSHYVSRPFSRTTQDGHAGLSPAVRRVGTARVPKSRSWWSPHH